MPTLKKKALSLYFRSGCLRQFTLTLYDDTQKRAHGMPPRQQARAGLGLVGAAGFEWQDEKVSELESVFGKDRVRVNPEKVKTRPGELDLIKELSHLQAHQFIVEAKFNPDTDTFKHALGFDTFVDLYGDALSVGEAIPDLIQVFPAMTDREAWEYDELNLEPNPTEFEVLPNGDTQLLTPQDTRLRLRVIDIKLTAEPGAHYFAEVVYYSMALAAWLVNQNQQDAFVVVAAPAVWPGSYDASPLRKLQTLCKKELRLPTDEELVTTLNEDLEVALVDVYAPRLKRFLLDELPAALQTPWQDLPLHVNSACAGCDFLGYPWRDRKGELTNDELHCWPTAERTGHLSRVAGLSRGSARLLSPNAPDLGTLAQIVSGDAAFEKSSTLRAKRTLFPSRAAALEEDQTGIIPESGGDALMPKWPDLQLYIFLDYDLSSAITASFGLSADWREPFPYGSPLKGSEQVRQWSARKSSTEKGFQEVHVVDQRDLERERDEFLRFLRSIKRILDAVLKQDAKDIAAGRRSTDPNKPDKVTRSRYQIYLWDEAQRKHLARLVGRYLPEILADSDIRSLAWLFPPSELLARSEESSYNSPFTIVSHVVQNTLAVPVPHHYTLVEAVKTYHPPSVKPPNIHPLYHDPMSDLIPGERIHHLWTRGDGWDTTLTVLKETTQKKLTALDYVANRLESDLDGVLNRAAAPEINLTPSALAGVPPQSKLWHEYTKLNQALQELDSHAVRAMPAHEREARFKSAHLLERLEGEERIEALKALFPDEDDQPDAIEQVIVYTLDPNSAELNVRPPAMSRVLSPRKDPSFLHQAAYPLIKDHDEVRKLVKGSLKGNVLTAGLTEVTITAINRTKNLIALKPGLFNIVAHLEAVGALDFSHDLMLDDSTKDHLTKKLRPTLQGIGSPASAQGKDVALKALGLEAEPDKPSTLESPASEFLWQAQTLAATVQPADLKGVRNALEGAGVRLNLSQWKAWEAALTRRLAVIWGPPGTGKSQTLRAVVAAAVYLAYQEGRPFRLLIASQTYNAVDNVLIGVDSLLAKLLPEKPYRLVRIQSNYSAPNKEVTKRPDIEVLEVKTVQAPEVIQELQKQLEQPTGIVIVAGPSQQLHNLAIATKNKTALKGLKLTGATQRQWFDLTLIDEASQLDVAESTLTVSKAAEGGAFVLAGDDKQLPPIHQATPPEGLEYAVGSVYSYIRHEHDIEPYPLQVNYRSNKTIVELTKHAGYDPKLRAEHEGLKLSLLGDFPDARPDGWPTSLYWTPAWNTLLDPDLPATCFVYPDEVASQANDFEADAIAALMWLLYGRLDAQLAGEKDEHGDLKPLTGKPHEGKEFWKHTVGVVTPHRAQMGKIVGRLQSVFPEHDPQGIRGAVDTVERFQGQQRDVILASFGLGDPDLIRAEDEFLYSLNRFNVMASRARAKLIVFVTRSLVDHLSDDTDVLKESRLLKYFVDTFCTDPEPLTLGYIDQGKAINVAGTMRSRTIP